MVERIIMLQRSRSFCFKHIKDSLFWSIIALEAWDYAKIWFEKKRETRGKNGQVSEVELGVLGAHLKKKRETKKRERKKW